MKNQISWLVTLLLAGSITYSCTGLDDSPLPLDASEQIYFKDFEIDPKRDYILGRVVNDSPHTLTSCKIEINIYQDGFNSEDSLSLQELQVGDSLLTGLRLVMKERMFMRETLKPGYSTEIYFELRLQDLKGSAVFTKQLVDLKGKMKP